MTTLLSLVVSPVALVLIMLWVLGLLVALRVRDKAKMAVVVLHSCLTP